MWRIRGGNLLANNNSQSFPIFAIILNEHGGVRGEARFPPPPPPPIKSIIILIIYHEEIK